MATQPVSVGFGSPAWAWARGPAGADPGAGWSMGDTRGCIWSSGCSLVATHSSVPGRAEVSWPPMLTLGQSPLNVWPDGASRASLPPLLAQHMLLRGPHHAHSSKDLLLAIPLSSPPPPPPPSHSSIYSLHYPLCWLPATGTTVGDLCPTFPRVSLADPIGLPPGGGSGEGFPRELACSLV